MSLIKLIMNSTWTPPEFNRLLMTALSEGRDDYILVFYLARYGGLRVHECFRIDTAIAEDALRETLRRTKRGYKLLVPDDMPTDDAIYGIQKFLLDHRKELRDEGDERPLTLRVEDLMPILGIGRNTAYELVRSGQIRSVRIGRQIRVPKDALADYLSQRRPLGGPLYHGLRPRDRQTNSKIHLRQDAKRGSGAADADHGRTG